MIINQVFRSWRILLRGSFLWDNHFGVDLSRMSENGKNNVVVSSVGSENGEHFVIVKRPSNVVIPPLPPVVIDIDSLDQALHPNRSIINNGYQPSRSQQSESPTYDRREPIEIAFLSQIEKLKITHNSLEQCIKCCQSLEFLNPEGEVIMKATKQTGCFHQNFEIFHLASRELVILVEITEWTLSCILPNTVQVYAPPGKSLGFVDHYSTTCGCKGYFEIRDANGISIYTVEQKPKCFGPNEYPIVCKGEESKGKVAELVSKGCFCGIEVDVNFIQNIPPSSRALVLGLALLVDIMESHTNFDPGVV